MLFAATCACVDYFSVLLKHFLPKTKIFSIHGKMKSKRHKIFNKYRQIDQGILICTDVMARGVDIPDVQWVVQVDPPSNAEAFVHRCGRTARIGNKGAAVLLIGPSEETYIDFLAINQKVTLQQIAAPEDTIDLLSETRKILKSDRSNMDKATRAFVSFIQSYAKHECSVILKIKDLDLGGLATSYGLLKMPKMPEIKRSSIINFEDEKMDLNEVAYVDKTREKVRQEKLATYKETGQWPGLENRKKETLAWSKNQEVLDKRREKKLRKFEKRKAAEVVEEESEEEDDFQEDYKMKKKLESDINELEIALDHANKANSDLQKHIKKLQSELKDMSVRVEEEQRLSAEYREQYGIAERRANALQGELEESRTLLEQSDRGRRQAEAELAEATEALNEVSAQANALGMAKRKLEGELTALHADLDEMLNEAKNSEEKAKKAMVDAARLADELRAEQEHAQNQEKMRKGLEIQVKELEIRFEEAEANAIKATKKQISKLEARVKEP